mmetsp:Transcript_82363/g.254588  ORF Transcript_82363/g.254588 Transcript_82363/m.254588 type:complete len:212 (-) Transcript_82363:7-642(-)
MRALPRPSRRKPPALQPWRPPLRSTASPSAWTPCGLERHPPSPAAPRCAPPPPPIWPCPSAARHWEGVRARPASDRSRCAAVPPLRRGGRTFGAAWPMGRAAPKPLGPSAWRGPPRAPRLAARGRRGLRRVPRPSARWHRPGRRPAPAPPRARAAGRTSGGAWRPLPPGPRPGKQRARPRGCALGSSSVHARWRLHGATSLHIYPSWALAT